EFYVNRRRCRVSRCARGRSALTQRSRRNAQSAPRLPSRDLAPLASFALKVLLSSVPWRVFRHDADVFDAAIALGVIHAVADHEAVGNLETDVVGLDGDEAALVLVQAGCDLQRRRLVLQHQVAEVVERKPGVEDVFDDDDVPAFDGVVDVFDELDGAWRNARTAVAGNGDEVEGVVDLNSAGEIREKDRRSLEDTDENNGLARVLFRNLFSECFHSFCDLVPCKKDVHGAWGNEGGQVRRHLRRLARKGMRKTRAESVFVRPAAILDENHVSLHSYWLLSTWYLRSAALAGRGVWNDHSAPQLPPQWCRCRRAECRCAGDTFGHRRRETLARTAKSC